MLDYWDDSDSIRKDNHNAPQQIPFPFGLMRNKKI